MNDLFAGDRADLRDLTDIVAAARLAAKWGIPDFTNARLLTALADEIERLRAALK